MFWVMGSPPRRRGKVSANSSAVSFFRIIPAQAGKSRARRVAEAVRRDHPRTGGEKLGKISAPNIGQGSPPHRRGKGAGQSGNTAKSRITPAWAGKSSRPADSLPGHRDHPRVGGEKNALSSGLWPKSGSPPRRRGKGTGFVLDTGNVGITPAQAGKGQE